MMVVKRSITFFLSVATLLCRAQHADLSIPLHSIEANAGLTTITEIFDENNILFNPLRPYSGIPSTVTEYIIKTLDLQPEQSIFGLYLRLEGKMSTQALAQGLRQYGLSLADTAQLSRSAIRNYISFLVGRNQAGQILVIGDSNNNGDFSDDRVFCFSSSVTTADLATLAPDDYSAAASFCYQHVYNGNIKDRSLFLRMAVRNSAVQYTYEDKLEQRFFLTVSLEEYKTGQLVTGEKIRNIKVVPARFTQPQYDDKSTRIFFTLNDWEAYFTVGDSVELSDSIYTIKRIAPLGDTLYLSVSPKTERGYGVYVGDNAADIESLAADGQQFSLFSHRGKTILLDFWGTWCKPCKQILPELKKLHNKYSTDSFLLVSIAAENNNYNRWKEVIKKERMHWIQLAEIRSSGSIAQAGIIEKYRISAFPYFILIGPEGKIIMRGQGIDYLEKINGQLEKQFSP